MVTFRPTIVRRLSVLLFAAGLSVIAVVPGAAWSADFACRAEVNRTSVPQGGNVVLTVTGEGDLGWSADFALPDLPGLTVQSGGVNQSMTVVNGRTRTSVSRTWFLTVHEKKDFTIGPVRVSMESETCATDPIVIRVTDPKPSTTSPSAGTPAPPGAAPTAGRAGDDIFVTLEVDREEAWVGQQLILTFRYYRRVQPWNNPSYQPPRTEGFWREDLGPEKNYRRAVGGRPYNVTEINYALFPTRSGDLVIEPAVLTFPEDVFDRFFSTRRRGGGPRALRTEGITVKVRDLPLPRPEGFSGIAATSCVLRASVDRDSVPRGEAVGLKIQLESDGFLQGFDGLTVAEPDGSRLHDATEGFQTLPGKGRLNGLVSVEKVIIPGAEGTLLVPGLALSWFDVELGRYRTATTPDLEVAVLPSDKPSTAFEESGFLRQELARLGDDLAFIHPVPSRLSFGSGPWTGSPGWWILLAAPVVLLGVARFLLARSAASRRDPAGLRRRRALARAREVLSQDRADEASWGRLARAVTGFVADATNLPPATVGAAEVREFARGLGAEVTGDRLAELLAAADAARFGGDSPAAAESTEVLGLLEELDGRLRQPGRAGGPGTVWGLAVLVLAGAVLVGGSTADDREGPDPVRLMAEANQAYTAGEVGAALDLYLSVRAMGVDDPVLHYNLGNAQARSGRLGEAVASYLRARRLAPRDADVAGNLVWVRRNLKDLELTETELPLFIAQAAALVEAFTLDQWGLFLVVAAWILAGLLAWAWWREDYGIWLRRALLAGVALVVAVGAVTAGRWYRERVVNQAVVVAEVDVRSGPAENFPVQFRVHDGLTVQIQEEREGWVRIGMGGDWEGWLPAPAVEAVRRDQGR